MQLMSENAPPYKNHCEQGEPEIKTKHHTLCPENREKSAQTLSGKESTKDFQFSYLPPMVTELWCIKDSCSSEVIKNGRDVGTPEQSVRDIIKPSVRFDTTHQVSFLPCVSGAVTVPISKTTFIGLRCFMDLVDRGFLPLRWPFHLVGLR